MDDGALLKLESVVAGYGPTVCLKEVTLSVHQGEIVALLGANGAGKTTTLSAISGLVRVRRGVIALNGKRIDTQSPEKIAAMGVGHVPEGRRIFSRLTVLENLELGAYLRRDPSGIGEDLEKVFALFPTLKERRGQLAGTLSGGEQQMLAMGRGLMGRPKLLLLDEPSLGLAPKMVLTVFDIITRINRTGTTILLVEQNIRMALKIANRGYILETGTMAISDTAENLANNPQVKAAYLGG